MQKKWTVEYSSIDQSQPNSYPKLSNQLQLEVDFSTEYIRKSTLTSEKIIARAKIDLGKLIADISDLPKFRLKDIVISADRILLKIGLTSYADYLATNYQLRANKRLRKLGLRIEQNADAYLANAIGNLAIIETLNHKLILIRRSTSVATFQNQFDAPGGHPEPTLTYLGDRNDLEFMNVGIRNELQDSIEREIQEEIGVEKQHFDSVFLLAIIRNLDAGYKPEMIFYAKINLLDTDVNKLYENAIDRDESSRLFFLDWRNREVLISFIENETVTTPALAGITILRQWEESSSYL